MEAPSSIDPSVGLVDYARIIRRRLPMIMVIWVVVAGAASGYITSQPNRYQSRAVVLLRTFENQSLFPAVSQNQVQFLRDPNAELEFATSSLLSSAIDRSAAAGSIRITSPDQSNQLAFAATAADPQTAIDTANTWAQAYVDLRAASTKAELESVLATNASVLADLEAQRDAILEPIKPLDDSLARTLDPDVVSRLTTQRLSLLQSLQDQLLPVENQIRQLSATQSQALIDQRFLDVPGVSAVVSDPATGAPKVSPNPGRDLPIAVVMALFLGVGVAVLAETVQNTIRDEDDLRRGAPNVPILGHIPDPDNADLHTNRAEQVLATLTFTRAQNQGNRLAITSARMSEGKSALTLLLAERAALQGIRVLLVDADLRRPTLHERLGLPRTPGLTDFIDTGWATSPESPGSDFVPAGSEVSNPTATLQQPAALEIYSKFGSEHDLVLVDTPPVLPVADALILSTLAADRTIMVARVGYSKRSEIRTALRKLALAGVHVSGIVLVGGKVTDRAYAYA